MEGGNDFPNLNPNRTLTKPYQLITKPYTEI